MDISHLMRHSADLWRANLGQDTSQKITGYELEQEGIACFIQPYDSTEAIFYEQRQISNATVVYTSDTTTEFERTDILEWNERQFHILGIKNGLFLNVYQELICEEFPEESKKRLSREAYE